MNTTSPHAPSALDCVDAIHLSIEHVAGLISVLSLVTHYDSTLKANELAFVSQSVQTDADHLDAALAQWQQIRTDPLPDGLAHGLTHHVNALRLQAKKLARAAELIDYGTPPPTDKISTCNDRLQQSTDALRKALQAAQAATLQQHKPQPCPAP